MNPEMINIENIRKLPRSEWQKYIDEWHSYIAEQRRKDREQITKEHNKIEYQRRKNEPTPTTIVDNKEI